MLRNLLHIGFFKIFWAGVIIVLIIVRIKFENLKIDEITLGLLGLATVPWLVEFVETLKLPGGIELKIRELEKTVDDQQRVIEQQQEYINQLVKYLMSSSVFRHLCGIAILKEYVYHNSEPNKREMYFLRDSGYIKPKSEAFIDFGDRLNGQNLADIVEPTPIGWFCIKLRKDEIPQEMIADPDNVKVDPSTL